MRREGRGVPGRVLTVAVDVANEGMVEQFVLEASRDLGKINTVINKFIIECEYFTGRVFEADGGLSL